MDEMLARLGSVVPLTDIRLTAMGGYFRLLGQWRPADVAAPVLLVRASDPLPGLAGASDQNTSWRFPYAAVESPGDHFTLLEGHAHTTAHTIDTWLRGLT
jgi:hypothetical protein